jgi:hypothetical protein
MVDPGLEAIRGACLVMALFSLLSSIICTVVHHLIPKIRRNPGQLVHINCYVQVVEDCTWVLLFSSPNTYFYVLGCNFLGLIVTACFLLSNLYLLFFCLEIYILVSRKLVTPHTKRVRIYHILSIGITLLILLAANFAGGYGHDNGMFCLVKEGTMVANTFYGIVVLCLIFTWVLTVLVLRKLNNSDSNLTKRYLLIILISTVFISISFFFGLITLFIKDNAYLKQTGLLFSASVGLTLGIGRLYNKPLFREIMLKLCKKKVLIERDKRSIQLDAAETEDLQLSDSLIKLEGEPLSLSHYFESESLKLLLRIFTCLSLRFSRTANNLEAFNDYSEYYFEEEHFINILGSLAIDTIDDRKEYTVYDPNVTVREIQPAIFTKIREAYNITEKSLAR